MKKEDVVKKMNEIKNIVEKDYPGVKADIAINDWEKSGYHRLYINFVMTGRVNGKTARESASFGFLNLKTNRYNVKDGYDMRHFDAGEFTPAKMLYDYAEAYKTADNDKTLYVAKEGFRLTLGLSKTEEENGISRREMLDKSIEMNISPEKFDMYWDALNCAQSAQVTEKKDGHAGKKSGTEIGRYDGHIVSIRLSSADQYVVEDDGKRTGDYGDDRESGVYEAAMYLYDRMAEGHVITVFNDDAWGYIVENAAGLSVSIDADKETCTIKRREK